MPKWQIDPQDYLKRLNLDIKEFEQRLHLPNIQKINKILPLRDMKIIQSLIPISAEMLSYLIQHVKTLSGQMPFNNINIQMVKIDPRHLKIGQKFIYRENYQKLLEEVPDIFHRFMVSAGGLADLGAYFVFGLNGDNTYCLACYMPPIIEKHNSDLVIMDGIHRNYISKQAGLALNAILIEGTEIPFPCSPTDWSKIKVIPLAEKPKNMKDRYFNLKQELFRDLKYLGIDG